MRNFLIGSLLGFAAVSSLVSCQNKDYDADPKKDYKYAINPLDTGKHAIMISSMSGKVNGSMLLFSPAYYKVDTNNNRNFFASVRNDSVYFRTIEMQCIDSMVKNANDEDLKSYSLTYGVYDTVIKTRRLYKSDGSNGNLKIHITEDKDDGIRGFMAGTIGLTIPEPGNPADVVKFDTLFFYFDKRK